MSMNNKLLVPVVALLICAGAMVGIGYAALSSDYTVEGNSITGGQFEVSPGSGVTMSFDTTIPYDTHTTVSKDASGSTETVKSYTINNGQASNTGVITLLSGKTISITDTTSLGYTSYKVEVQVLKGTEELSINGVTYNVAYTVGGETRTNDTIGGTASNDTITVSSDVKTLSFDVTMDFTGVAFDDSTISQLDNQGLALKITVTGVTA